VSTLVTGAVVAVAVGLWALLWIPVGTRTRAYTTKVVIDRDREDVFAFLSDLRNALPILSGAQSVEKLTEGAVRLGSRFTADTRVGSVVFHDEDEIIAFEPPLRLAWRVEGYVRGTETVTLAELVHATEVSHRWQAVETYGYALLGLGLFRPLLNWAGARERRKSWDRLKRVLEGRPPT
jgi:carbon monoxide dehydrogenase subunit G